MQTLSPQKVLQHYCNSVLLLILQHDIPSVVESFDTIASTYAQQLAVNETQSFTTASLTLHTELVSLKLIKITTSLLYFAIHLTFRSVRLWMEEVIS